MHGAGWLLTVLLYYVFIYSLGYQNQFLFLFSSSLCVSVGVLLYDVLLFCDSSKQIDNTPHQGLKMTTDCNQNSFLIFLLRPWFGGFARGVNEWK